MRRFLHSLALASIFALLAVTCAAPPASLSAPTRSAVSPAAPPSPQPALSSPTPAPTPTLGPTAEPVSVAPVTGLPSGTDGYPWWNDTVFYEVFVRSFYDSDGDGNGDLQGLIARLDYLNDGDPATTADLGVTGLWLMPIFASPSYHGYDVTDYYAVNPDYGTNDDFKRLMTEARQRGIRVIVDFVLNHTSSRHPWFVEAQNPASPYRNWFIWTEAHPGFVGPWGQTVWHYAPGGVYYYGVFSTGMPDLNYAYPNVSQQMLDVARFWLEGLGADGFRLDGARYLIEAGRNQADTDATHQWYKDFRQFYKQVNPQAVTVGEVWTQNDAVSHYVQGDELDLAFNFDLATGFIRSARDRNAIDTRTQLLLAARLFKPGQFGIFLSNHDQERVMSQLGGREDQARLAAALLLTAPGAPFLYYGEEIGMAGRKPDEKIRTPMQWTADPHAGFTAGTPWEPANSDYPEKNVAAQSAEPDSLLSFYRALIHLRAGHAALRVGETYVIPSEPQGVYAVLRASKDETVLVVVNLDSAPVSEYHLSLDSGPLSGSYAVAPLLGEGAFYGPMVNSQGGFDAYRPLSTLEANGVYILQLRK